MSLLEVEIDFKICHICKKNISTIDDVSTTR